MIDGNAGLERVELVEALLLFLLAGRLVAGVDFGLLLFGVGVGCCGRGAGLDFVALIGGFGWLFRSGQINEREARDHPRRTALQKALGAGNQFVSPQVGAVAYEPGDRFLLCTDGLVEGLFDSQLAELIRSPSPAEATLDPAQRLVDASLERAGRDNTTALIIEVG